MEREIDEFLAQLNGMNQSELEQMDQAEMAQIDAYLRACQDRPGCTVPAGDAK